MSKIIPIRNIEDNSPQEYAISPIEIQACVGAIRALVLSDAEVELTAFAKKMVMCGFGVGFTYGMKKALENHVEEPVQSIC